MAIIISGIYKIVNSVNGNFYIGSSSNIEKRWRRHKNDLNNARHHSAYLQRSWNKYGECNFEFLVIEECEISMLLEREQIYINTLKPVFNICENTSSPMLGRKHTDESREKMSNILIGNKRTLGYKQTDEAKAKTSVAQKGRIKSIEERKHISEARMGMVFSQETKDKISTNNHWNGKVGNRLGSHHTQETRDKLSELRRGRVLSEEHKIKIGIGSRAAWKKKKQLESEPIFVVK